MKIKLLLLLFLPFFTPAQIPAYYSSIDFSQTGDNLKVQLTFLISTTHTANLTYTPGVWNALKQTDLDPANPSRVFLIYGYNDTDGLHINDRTRDKDSNCTSSNCTGLWTREHTFPQSLGNPPLGTMGPGSDAHHLRAIDSDMNNLRASKEYNSGTGNAHVLPNGNFYPGDEWKGDVARMMMYMYVRYETQCMPTDVGFGSTSYSNFGDMPDIFLEWNQQDTVSLYEKNRNNILQSLQGNRNPFIDNPYIATLIWNGPAATDSWNALSTPEYAITHVGVYPTCTTGYVYLSNPENKTFTYNVLNTYGQLISNGTTTSIIDLSGNIKGVYIIKISYQKESIIAKAILE